MKLIHHVECVLQEGDIRRIKQPFVQDPCIAKCKGIDTISCCGCPDERKYSKFVKEMEEANCWDLYLEYHRYLGIQEKLFQLHADMEHIESVMREAGIPLNSERKFAVVSVPCEDSSQ